MLQHALAETLAARPSLTTITVTHELESLPAETTHVLLLKAGTVVAAGLLGETLTAANVASCSTSRSRSPRASALADPHFHPGGGSPSSRGRTEMFLPRDVSAARGGAYRGMEATTNHRRFP